MISTERDIIRVDVPVGRMLPAPREIEVSVDRPGDGPLAVKLRLIPGRVVEPRPRRMAAAPYPRRKAPPKSVYDDEIGGGD